MKFGKFNSKDNKYNKLKELKSEGRVDEKEIGELSRGQKIVNYITLILSIIGVIITIYFSIVGYRMGLFTDQEKLKAFRLSWKRSTLGFYSNTNNPNSYTNYTRCINLPSWSLSFWKWIWLYS